MPEFRFQDRTIYVPVESRDFFLKPELQKNPAYGPVFSALYVGSMHLSAVMHIVPKVESRHYSLLEVHRDANPLEARSHYYGDCDVDRISLKHLSIGNNRYNFALLAEGTEGYLEDLIPYLRDECQILFEGSHCPNSLSMLGLEQQAENLYRKSTTEAKSLLTVIHNSDIPNSA